MTDKTKTPARPLYEIAREIHADWKKTNPTDWKKRFYAAEAYSTPMHSLDSINDRYIMDSASGIVARFLGNATTWRGETAKRIKAELNAMLKNR
jgi:hypothetical protein